MGALFRCSPALLAKLTKLEADKVALEAQAIELTVTIGPKPTFDRERSLQFLEFANAHLAAFFSQDWNGDAPNPHADWLRSLVEKIVVKPGAEPGTREILFYGRIATLMIDAGIVVSGEAADESPDKTKPSGFEPEGFVSMVAGARNLREKLKHHHSVTPLMLPIHHPRSEGHLSRRHQATKARKRADGTYAHGNNS